ncbi:hypothetical protein MKX83_24070 [Cytobacillus sp. FSL M8-0252]|uniref:hypothetical protein n=1 Tax=Cytobacillus sp. FSL M8-0252 TaxID=2921621 RepID=UPI0030FD1CCF
MNKLLHIHSSCPRCKRGFMTPYSIIRYEDNAFKMIEINTPHNWEKDLKEGDFILSICSLDICGYTERIATQNTLYKKREKQKIRGIQ